MRSLFRSANSLKQRPRAGIKKHLRGQSAQRHRIPLTARCTVMNLHGFTRLRGRHNREDLVHRSVAAARNRHSCPAVNPDRYLAAPTQRGQSSTFCSYSETGGLVIEVRYCFNRSRIVLPRFYRQRTLAGCWTKIFGIEPLTQPVRLAKSLQPSGSQQDCINLPFGQLSQARIHIAAKLDCLNIRSQSF
jgi:hypothetical protein